MRLLAYEWYGVGEVGSRVSHDDEALESLPGASLERTLHAPDYERFSRLGQLC